MLRTLGALHGGPAQTVIPQSLRPIVQDVLGKRARIARVEQAGGGCISTCVRIATENGQTFFLKFHAPAPPGFYAAEAHGLETLRAAAGADGVASVLRVPRVISFSADGDGRVLYILLEDLQARQDRNERGSRHDVARRIGQGLARIHSQAVSRFGFDQDNYLGTTPQSNTWCDSWSTFFCEHRILMLVKILADSGRAAPSFVKAVESTLPVIEMLLDECHCAPSLLHGDLWGGNWLVSDDGRPALIDPAVYQGHSEADLAMTELFGGFPPDFYEGYYETRPSETGYPARRGIYQLHHLLNHYLLFGGGHGAQCLAILQRL